MYHLMDFVMASSCLRVASPSFIIMPRSRAIRLFGKRYKAWNLSFLIPFAFMVFAVFTAPESPEQLASICERHNPILACQVW